MTDIGELGRIERAENGVYTITIDRPPVNAPRFADLADLNELVKELTDEDAMRCVVLTAAGERGFVPGPDITELAELTAESAEQNTDLVQELLERIYELPVPVIGAVNGAALGLGMAVAAVCDVRVASENAVFGLPEIDLAVLGGSAHTARMLPPGKTRLMMYTGWRVDAFEAYRLGMVESVHAPGELMDEARRIADTIAEKYPPAVRLAKVGLNETEDMPLMEAYAFECTLTTKLREDPEAAAVAERFLANRKKR
ncbi:MAG: enoyl-CoA hydratase-related protein [Gaiellaceae bacterium]